MKLHGEKSQASARSYLALISQHYYPEMISTGMHMTELATGLYRAGHRIRVYCAQPAYGVETGDGPVPPFMTHEGVEIVRVPGLGDPRGAPLSRGAFAGTFLLAVAWTMLRDRNLLSRTLVTTNPPFAGLAAVLLKWLIGLEFVTIVYDVYPEIAVRLGLMTERSPIARLWSKLSRVILNQSKVVVVIGRDMEEIVRPKLKDKNTGRLRLIPNWSDEKRVKPVPPDENEFARRHQLLTRFVIQYSGRMGRTHNLEALLEAAELLQGEPVLFQMIGDGAKREALQAAAREKELQNVQFLPYQPIDDLDKVLSAADLAVVCLDRRFTGLSVPSKTYGIMASGRPILGFLDPEGEIARVMEENECGIVLPEPTGQEVAAIIRDMMNRPEQLKVMGANGRCAFLDNYTLTRAVERYDAVLRAIRK